MFHYDCRRERLQKIKIINYILLSSICIANWSLPSTNYLPFKTQDIPNFDSSPSLDFIQSLHWSNIESNFIHSYSRVTSGQLNTEKCITPLLFLQGAFNKPYFIVLMRVKYTSFVFPFDSFDL